jgi:hypothetical protein
MAKHNPSVTKAPVRLDVAGPARLSVEGSIPAFFTLVILIKMRGFPVSMKSGRCRVAVWCAGLAQKRLRLLSAMQRVSPRCIVDGI